MSNRVSNFKVAVIVTILVGVIYALSAERTHSTRHLQAKKVIEQEDTIDVSFVPRMPKGK